MVKKSMVKKSKKKREEALIDGYRYLQTNKHSTTWYCIHIRTKGIECKGSTINKNHVPKCTFEQIFDNSEKGRILDDTVKRLEEQKMQGGFANDEAELKLYKRKVEKLSSKIIRRFSKDKEITLKDLLEATNAGKDLLIHTVVAMEMANKAMITIAGNIVII